MTPSEKRERWLTDAKQAGCPIGQIQNFVKASFFPQERQLSFAAAARSCDMTDGPTRILTGGARGGGKSTIVLAQMVIDDCQRYDGLKGLWLRKVGKANIEHLSDMRTRILRGVPHRYRMDGTLTLDQNNSRIVCGHFQNENDIDGYLGMEYDVIAVEEATTLTDSKHRNIRTCLRSSKPGWRPREYLTTNPGGVGHGRIKREFIDPWRSGVEADTRFIPSRCVDNRFNNPEYIKILESLPPGWQRRAWLDGDWDIAAGQFFTNWREDKHVIDHFDERKAMSWFAAIDMGFRHWFVCLLGCVTGDGQIVVVDEHAGRQMIPREHHGAIRAMMARHSLTSFEQLDYCVAGADIFATESDGASVAAEFGDMGLHLGVAEMDRVNGWASITHRLGNPEGREFWPKLVVHRRCRGLIDRMPAMIHSDIKPEDMEKVDCDSDTGEGGDDHVDCLRYLVASFKGETLLKWAAPLSKPRYHGHLA